MTIDDRLAVVRVALGAATQSGDPVVAAMYLAVARTSLAHAQEEARSLETLLIARERELAARPGPTEQLAIEGVRNAQ